MNQDLIILVASLENSVLYVSMKMSLAKRMNRGLAFRKAIWSQEVLEENIWKESW